MFFLCLRKILSPCFSEIPWGWEQASKPKLSGFGMGPSQGAVRQLLEGWKEMLLCRAWGRWHSRTQRLRLQLPGKMRCEPLPVLPRGKNCPRCQSREELGEGELKIPAGRTHWKSVGFSSGKAELLTQNSAGSQEK